MPEPSFHSSRHMANHQSAEMAKRLKRIAWALTFLALLLPLLMGLARSNRWPLTGDESLYAFWARHWLENRDPLFLAHWIDKPPIYLWLQSLSLYTFGIEAASARYVNILAVSLLCFGLGYFAWRQWGWRSACLCYCLTVANPMVLAFGPTGLTDPIFVLAGTAACLLACRRQFGASGALLAVSIFCKQAGILFLPLTVCTVWLFQSENWRQDAKTWLKGLLSVSIPILFWDGVRMIWAPSFWSAGFAHYAPLQLTSVAEVGPRLGTWLPLYGTVLGGWLGWAAWGILLAAAGWSKRLTPISREDRWVGLSLVWAGGFALLHWLLSFNPWIRYLLPLVPVLVLSTGWAVNVLWSSGNSPWRRLLLGLLLLSMSLSLASGWEDGWQGALPEMQDNAGLAGLPEILDLLQATAPSDSLILHRELSWHFLFYLFDSTYPTRVWFADPHHIVEIVKALPPGIAVFHMRLERDASQTTAISLALKEAGFTNLLCAREARVSLFEILPTPASSCLYVQPS